MRKLLSGVVALFIVVLLASCALLPFGQSFGFNDDNHEQADAQMEKIADAVNSHDAAALKAMFSPRALEKATDLDEGLDYLLSYFPNGGLAWERDTVNSEGRNSHGVETELLKAFYTVSADGNDYRFFFADFTVNDFVDPDNVGIYGIGVTPQTETRHSGTSESFFWWTGSIRYDESDNDGYPGVYVGYDNDQLSLHMMTQIVDWLNRQSTMTLRDKFSEYARADHAMSIDDELGALIALFPEDALVWEDLDAAPVVRESSENGGETTLLLSIYQVSYAGAPYWLSFAYFPENAIDPTNIGVYAIGVAPRTEAGDSAAEQALFAWADSFDVAAITPPSIFIAQ